MPIRNEHYVPQGYLKEFANTDGKIWVFDKATQKTFPSDPKNIATERGFYDIPQELNNHQGDPEQIEKVFSDIETEFYRARDQMVEHSQNYLTEFIHLNIGHFMDHRNPERWSLQNRSLPGCLMHYPKGDIVEHIAIQALRTKKRRSGMKKIMMAPVKGVFRRWLYSGRLDPLPEGFTREQLDELVEPMYKDEFEPLHHAQMVLNPKIINTIVNHWMDFYWIIWWNISSKPFYTSDDPVLRIPHWDSGPYGNIGWAAPGIEIAFPLTPYVMVGIFEKNFWAESWVDNDGAIVLANTDDVNYFNEHQVRNAYRQIFCPKDDFSLIRNLISQNPDIADISEEDIQIDHVGPYIIARSSG